MNFEEVREFLAMFTHLLLKIIEKWMDLLMSPIYINFDFKALNNIDFLIVNIYLKWIYFIWVLINTINEKVHCM